MAGATDDIEEAPHRRAIERNFQVVDAAEEIAADHGATVPQVAIAWLLGVEGVTAPIVGARTLEHLEDVLPARLADAVRGGARAARGPGAAARVLPAADALRAGRARAADGAAQSALSSRSRSASSFQAPTEARRRPRARQVADDDAGLGEPVARGRRVGVLPAHERRLAARRDGPAALGERGRQASRERRRPRVAAVVALAAAGRRRARTRPPRATARACRSGGRRRAAGSRARAWCPRSSPSSARPPAAARGSRARRRASPCRRRRTATSGRRRRRRRSRARGRRRGSRRRPGRRRGPPARRASRRRRARARRSPTTTCEQATSVVRARHRIGDVPQRHRADGHPALAGGDQRPDKPGCSLSEVTISSPGPSSSPPSTAPRPSLVEVVSARSSARAAEHARVRLAQLAPGARSAWRSAARAGPRGAGRRAPRARPRRPSPGTGPSVPVFRNATRSKTGNSLRRASMRARR